MLNRANAVLPLNKLIPIAIAKLFADQVPPTAGIGGNVLLADRLTALGVQKRGGRCLADLASGLLHHLCRDGGDDARSVVDASCRDPFIVDVVTTFLIVALAIPTLALWLRRRGSRPLPERIERLRPIGSLLRTLGEAPADLTGDRTLVARVAACAGLVFLADAATLQACLLALGQPAPFSTAFIALISASIVATLGPIPLGLGSFEASCTGMLSLLGVPPANALAATLLLRISTLLLPLIPGLWLTGRLVKGR